MVECFDVKTMAEFMVFVCFGLWAVLTMVFFTVHALHPEKVKQRLEEMSGPHAWLKFIMSPHPFEVLTKMVIIAWLSMWCFRSMY